MNKRYFMKNFKFLTINYLFSGKFAVFIINSVLKVDFSSNNKAFSCLTLFGISMRLVYPTYLCRPFAYNIFRLNIIPFFLYGVLVHADFHANCFNWQ